MPILVKPSDFRAVIVEPDDNLGVAFVKAFLKFPVLVYRWVKFEHRPDGTFTDEYEDMLCQACSPLRGADPE